MKKLTRGIGIIIFLSLTLAGSQLWAQVSGNPVTVTINVTVQQFLWLWFDSNTITFSSTTPENPPAWISDTASPHDVVALAFVPTGQNVTLQAKASGNLVSGVETINVSDHIRWTGTVNFAGGPWYLTTSDQDIVNWTGFGIYTGTFIFEYLNDPQAPGSYTTKLVYLLVSP